MIHFEELMLLFGPCHEKIRVLEGVVTREIENPKIINESWQNQLRLYVDVRYVIDFPKWENKNFLRTVPHVDVMLFEKVKNFFLFDSKTLPNDFLDVTVQTKCCPVSYLPELLKRKLEKNKKQLFVKEVKRNDNYFYWVDNFLIEISQFPKIPKDVHDEILKKMDEYYSTFGQKPCATYVQAEVVERLLW